MTDDFLYMDEPERWEERTATNTAALLVGFATRIAKDDDPVPWFGLWDSFTDDEQWQVAGELCGLVADLVERDRNPHVRLPETGRFSEWAVEYAANEIKYPRDRFLRDDRETEEFRALTREDLLAMLDEMEDHPDEDEDEDEE